MRGCMRSSCGSERRNAREAAPNPCRRRRKETLTSFCPSTPRPGKMLKAATVPPLRLRPLFPLFPRNSEISKTLSPRRFAKHCRIYDEVLLGARLAGGRPFARVVLDLNLSPRSPKRIGQRNGGKGMKIISPSPFLCLHSFAKNSAAPFPCVYEHRAVCCSFFRCGPASTLADRNLLLSKHAPTGEKVRVSLRRLLQGLRPRLPRWACESTNPP